MILTTVRSLPLNEIRDHRLVQADRQWLRDNLGFLTDEHQINVAITRARQGLIIVGEYISPEHRYIYYHPALQVIALYWSMILILGSCLLSSTEQIDVLWKGASFLVVLKNSCQYTYY